MAATRTIKLRSRCVLVVTSHPLAALRMRAALKALPDSDISFVFDHAEAFLLARQEPPDLLILDYCLDGATGVNLAQAFRRLHPETAIIMLVTADNNPSRQEILELHPCCVLEKPINPAELYQVALAALTRPT
jgi:DNA-binding NarL/FixJ family response regulator